ncbi:hypothetical protein DFJ58DRAFT_839661 [Suillus subalutaceus]|uniref:uncharacterized protein n=1 Tax=Suillus subalutaceus TaxID=48586 RepID=UPI001B87BD7A|nr:uncharacterized protein DFJ58DRAFT_839661 [Suillus subalutaceus]KAG1861514.1 hypothetical protein DFJ58DRAFT_839661 [Suillus subalutaceus]
MGGSRVQEWTPKNKYSVVEWKKTHQTRRVVGKWGERPKIRRSVPPTPAKSPVKQAFYDMLYHGGDDCFDDLGATPLQLPKSLFCTDLHSRVKMTIFDNGCLRLGHISTYFLRGRFHQIGPVSYVGQMVSINVMGASISQWTGSFFEESCLVKTGLVIWLGHYGNPCPWDDDLGEMGFFADGGPEDTHDSDTDSEWDEEPTEPKTAFTFDALRDFLLDNLECGTSVMNYYSKLRRMTTSVFPHLVPDRYRELMRVVRQWWKLNLMRWNGFGHQDKQATPSNLALLCPACPQPGINVSLPTGDAAKGNECDTETPSWLYSRSLVMGGNFKVEHLHSANPSDEVSLMDGHGYGRRLHIQGALIPCQGSGSTLGVLEATGISRCTCARHGCFVPHAMVDFQEGERQMNMDHTLCEAPKLNTKGIRHALTFYDVNCQYHKHLKEHIADSPILQLDKELDIIPGIGLWHVHGHQDSCYVRYASNFIQGAAQINGEIMETLWAQLNIISPSARGMGSPHRKECLDYQMNDCNFMKMIRMSKFLCRKYKQAIKGAAESQLAFEKLDETADDDKVRDWEAQERMAQEWRCHDPTAMDIYEVQLQKGGSLFVWQASIHVVIAPTRKQQELQLLTAQGWQAGPAHRRGVATWLAEGLTIEEAQVTLQMDIRKLGHRPSAMQQLQIGRWQDSLQRDIDCWVEAGGLFLGDALGDNEIQIMELELVILQDDSDDEMQGELRVFEPEKVVIPLPSNLGLERCISLGVADLVEQELTLREGQANDALHNIRVHLADKALIFQKTVRFVKSQAKSTRAWAQVHSVDRVVSINASVYSKCQSQLCRLTANDALLERYQPLLKEHLKVSTTVADPNSRGQRNNMLAWFWSMDVQGDSDGSSWLNVFYCVHWLHTKALRDHWAEELLLVQHEMDWTCTCFSQKAEEWIGLQTISKEEEKEGHVAYVLPGDIERHTYKLREMIKHHIPEIASAWKQSRDIARRKVLKGSIPPITLVSLSQSTLRKIFRFQASGGRTQDFSHKATQVEVLTYNIAKPRRSNKLFVQRGPGDQKSRARLFQYVSNVREIKGKILCLTPWYNEGKAF